MRLWDWLMAAWGRTATPVSAAERFWRREHGGWRPWCRGILPRGGGTRPAPVGTLVLGIQPVGTALPLRFGYALAEPGPTGWMVTQASWSTVLQPGPLIFDCAALWQGGENRVLVFGYVAEPQVQTIEVRFANGSAGQDVPTNGLFAVVGPVFDADQQLTSDIVQEVCGLDGAGRIVQCLTFDQIARRSMARVQSSR